MLVLVPVLALLEVDAVVAVLSDVVEEVAVAVLVLEMLAVLEVDSVLDEVDVDVAVLVLEVLAVDAAKPGMPRRMWALRAPGTACRVGPAA